MTYIFEYIESNNLTHQTFYQSLSFLFSVNVHTLLISLGVSDGDESVGQLREAASSFSVRIILRYTPFNLTTNPESPSSSFFFFFFFFARSKIDVWNHSVVTEQWFNQRTNTPGSSRTFKKKKKKKKRPACNFKLAVERLAGQCGTR